MCSCNYGWSGDSCEIGPCTGVICQNEGVCQVDFEMDDLHVCVCNSPYYGDNCELDSCAEITCENGGTCLNDGKTSDAWCDCQPGYDGDFCQSTPCTDINCNSGSCNIVKIDELSQFECTCPPGYPESTYCESTPCDEANFTCENGGSCINTEINDMWTATCNCAVGFYGATCSEIDSCAGVEFLKVECRDDLTVNVRIESSECFSQEYPSKSAADLVIFAMEEKDVTEANTCIAYAEGETGSNWIYSDSSMSSPVTAESTTLYFDSKTCGSDAKFDEITKELVYEAKVGTYVHNSDTSLLVNPSMIGVKLRCKYSQYINGPVGIGSLILDEKKDTKKITQDDPSKFAVTTTVLAETSDGSYEEVKDEVALGTSVKIVFTSTSNQLPIYVKECIAKNTNNDEFTHSIKLVDKDCYVDASTGVLAFIDPKHDGSTCSEDSCQTVLKMNQFAFIENSAPDLVFFMECSVAIGSPSCENRRRLKTQDFELISFSYRITPSNKNLTITDGIVVSRDIESAFQVIKSVFCLILLFLTI